MKVVKKKKGAEIATHTAIINGIIINSIIRRFYWPRLPTSRNTRTR
jgi:hypothetical protein